MNPGDPQNARLFQMMNELQMSDTITTYNKLVERCFTYCIKDFRNNTMSNKETQCVMQFGEKFLRYSQRTSVRFAEHQQRMQAKMQEDLMNQNNGGQE